MSVFVSGANIFLTRRPVLRDSAFLPGVHGVGTWIPVALNNLGACATAVSEQQGAIGESELFGSTGESQQSGSIGHSVECGE